MSSMSVKPECESIVLKVKNSKVLKFWGRHKVSSYRLSPIPYRLLCIHLIPRERYNLHNSRKNRQRKPKYKYSCKKECNRLDEFHHGIECEIDLPLVLDCNFLYNIPDGRGFLSALHHLENISREEESRLIPFSHRSRDLRSMSDIFCYEDEEFIDNLIPCTLTGESKCLYNTDSWAIEEVKCRHRANDEVVLVDFSGEREIELLMIPPSFPRVTSGISLEKKSSSKQNKENIEEIVLKETTRSNKASGCPRKITRHLSNNWHELRNHIDHHDWKCYEEKYHDNNRISHRTDDLIFEIFLCSKVSSNREKWLLKHPRLFATFDDGNFLFIEEVREFSHRNIDRISSFDEEEKIIDSFSELSFRVTIDESLECWDKCDSSFEEIRYIFIEKCFILDGDTGEKKIHISIDN